MAHEMDDEELFETQKMLDSFKGNVWDIKAKQPKRKGLYDLMFTDKGFIRGGQYDKPSSKKIKVES